MSTPTTTVKNFRCSLAALGCEVVAQKAWKALKSAPPPTPPHTPTVALALRSLVFAARLLSYTSHFPTGLYINEEEWAPGPLEIRSNPRSITTWVPLTSEGRKMKKSERNVHSWCGDGTSNRFYTFIATIHSHLFGAPFLPSDEREHHATRSGQKKGKATADDEQQEQQEQIMENFTYKLWAPGGIREWHSCGCGRCFTKAGARSRLDSIQGLQQLTLEMIWILILNKIIIQRCFYVILIFDALQIFDRKKLW